MDYNTILIQFLSKKNKIEYKSIIFQYRILCYTIDKVLTKIGMQ